MRWRLVWNAILAAAERQRLELQWTSRSQVACSAPRAVPLHFVSSRGRERIGGVTFAAAGQWRRHVACCSWLADGAFGNPMAATQRRLGFSEGLLPALAAAALAAGVICGRGGRGVLTARPGVAVAARRRRIPGELIAGWCTAY